jgi:hypothetical protein
MSLSAPFVVDLPYSAQQLAALLDILYEHNLEVRVGFCDPWLCWCRSAYATCIASFDFAHDWSRYSIAGTVFSHAPALC